MAKPMLVDITFEGIDLKLEKVRVIDTGPKACAFVHLEEKANGFQLLLGGVDLRPTLEAKGKVDIVQVFLPDDNRLLKIDGVDWISLSNGVRLNLCSKLLHLDQLADDTYRLSYTNSFIESTQKISSIKITKVKP